MRYHINEVNIMLELYENIKRLRKELGITQTELARMVGYADKSMIARIEAGQIDLGQSKIEAFAKALRTTPTKLMGYEETEEDRVRAMLQEMKDNPQLGVLLSSTKDLNEEDLKMVIEMVKRLKASYRE